MHHGSTSIMLMAWRLCVQLERAHAITMHLRSREFPTYLAQAEAARVLAELERLASAAAQQQCCARPHRCSLSRPPGRSLKAQGAGRCLLC